MLKTLMVIVFIAAALSLTGCDTSDGTSQTVFKKEPQMTVIKPHNPVRIKLKRNASGKYSWELSGDDTSRIVNADRKLKEYTESDGAMAPPVR